MLHPNHHFSLPQQNTEASKMPRKLVLAFLILAVIGLLPESNNCLPVKSLDERQLIRTKKGRKCSGKLLISLIKL